MHETKGFSLGKTKLEHEEEEKDDDNRAKEGTNRHVKIQKTSMGLIVITMVVEDFLTEFFFLDSEDDQRGRV